MPGVNDQTKWRMEISLICLPHSNSRWSRLPISASGVMGVFTLKGFDYRMLEATLAWPAMLLGQTTKQPLSMSLVSETFSVFLTFQC